MKKIIPIEEKKLAALKSCPIGQTLRWIRAWNNHTQTDFAELIGSSQPVISSWETGSRVPNQRHIAKIAITYCLPNDFYENLLRQSKQKSE